MQVKIHSLQYSLIVLLLLQIISGFFPENIFWGIDYYRYIPYGFFFIVFFIITYTALIWLSSKYLKGLLDNIKNFILTKPRILLSISIPTVGGLIFYLFRVKLFFLGDGYLRIRNITKGFYFIVEEPLNIFIHWLFYKSLSSIITINAAQTYALISIACGIIFIFLLIFFIKYLGDTSHQQWLTFLALCTSGTMLLFFGYAESYTIVTVLLTWFLIESIRCIKKNTPPLISSLILGLSIATHLSVVNMLPALLYLWLKYFRSHSGMKKRLIMGSAGVGFIIFPILITIFVFSTKEFPLSELTDSFSRSSHYLPFFNVPDESLYIAYSLISFPHLLDIINELYLISPLFFVVIFLLLLYGKKIFFSFDTQWVFFLIASGIYLISFIGFNLKIGGSRDWDLFSPMTIPLVLLSMRSIFLVKLRLNQKELYVLGMFLLLHIIPWITVNANKSWSLDRFKTMIEDPKWSKEAKADAFDELRAYYLNKGKDDIAYIYAKKAVSYYKLARFYYNVAYVADRLNRYDEAIINHQKALEIDPYYYNVYLNYSHILFKKGQFKEALAVCEVGKKLFETADLYFNAAINLRKLNRLDEAAINYQQAFKIDPNNYNAYINCGEILFKKRQFKEALVVYEAAKQQFETADLYFNTAVVLYYMKRYSEAIQNAKNSLKLKPNDPEALSLLNKLKQIQK